MKKFFCFICLAYLSFPMKAQEALSLDSCRALAISNNKELLISQEKINAAHYQRKAAFTNYLPNISAVTAGCPSHRTASSRTGRPIAGFRTKPGRCPRRCRPILGWRLSYRHPQHVCGRTDLDPTPIYGRQDTCLQQNYQIRRRAGPPAAQHRYAGSNPEYRPGILAGSVPCP